MSRRAGNRCSVDALEAEHPAFGIQVTFEPNLHSSRQLPGCAVLGTKAHTDGSPLDRQLSH